nr:hypothetical protein HKQZZDGK_HKQZZDGK_CDS_0005 [Microvirus sp.]CAI9752386.1 hypothetical protein RTDJWYLK_RTDJWYLK_CDS_0005 [Microvirus sp.]
MVCGCAVFRQKNVKTAVAWLRVSDLPKECHSVPLVGTDW